VLRAADSMNLNPQARNAQNILRYWRSPEYRPCILAFSSSPNQAVAANPNVDIMRLRNDRLWRIDLFATYMRRFDGIFYPGLHPSIDWLGLKARALLGSRAPVIATLEGLLGELGDDERERRFAAIAHHPVYCQRVPRSSVQRAEAICEMADHIITISPFLAQLARVRYGPKVSMLPLGVDTAIFARPTWSRRPRLRVAGAGGVRVHKRPQLFVALARTFPQADFVWFGEGDLRPSLMAEIRHSGLGNLEFPGEVTQEILAQEFAHSDVFVLPSLSEGVPKVTQEAAAAGLAQIIFGFFEAPTVVDGRNGFVVWTDEELIARLGELLDDPDLVARMGFAGAEMATVWSWSVVAPQWERRIIDVLEGRLAVAEA